MNNASLQDHSQSDPAMPARLRLLILEDRPADAELMVHQLERSGFAPNWQRVETEQEFASALVPELDLVLAHELAATPAQAAAVAAADAPVREYLESRLGDLLQAFNQFTVSGRIPAGPGPGAEKAPALLASVQDAIRVLEQTKRSFKSRALGSLRERLEAVVRGLAPAGAAIDVERTSVLKTSR